MRIHCLPVCLSLILLTVPAVAEDEFDRPPISYRTATPENDLTEFQRRIDEGELDLEYDPERGYLEAVLKELDVPVESQVLVFSKTSLQARRITPKAPRAIYFNDDLYIGYCKSGDKLEFTVMDSQLGSVFYTMSQDQVERPVLHREIDDCLTCHSSSRTEGVPGLLARSLFVNATGFPIFSGGSQNVDHTTPIEKRWGGWYVTGTHGAQKHQGNLIIRAQEVPREVENSAGMNVTGLEDRFHVGHYLTPHSDIVSLMVLEHQVLVHNRLVKANFTTRQALDYEQTLNRSQSDPSGGRRESTTRRIKNVGDALIDSILLVGEAPISEQMTGTAGFAEQFSARGPHDSQGRSLRDLDLKTRLFKYPMSYLVYSKPFRELPVELREYVWQELWHILGENAHPERFAHLSAEDRQAIVEILQETVPDLPDYWKPAQPVHAEN